MVKKMDPYEEGLDSEFSFGFEKLKLIFGFVMCLAEVAAALLRSETPMDRKDVGGYGGLRQNSSMFHSVATRFF